MIGRIIFFASVISFGTWIGWMAFFDRVVPYEYFQGRIYPSPAKFGSQVWLEWNPIKVHRVCPGNVHRMLFDADTGELFHSYDRTPSSISVKMGDTRLPKSLSLPPPPPPSVQIPTKIKYVTNVCFQCNLLQELIPTLAICVSTPELFFNIEP